MRRLGLNEIREEYLEFFESKGHLRLKSYPLIPNNDKSLLLINAGMAPLKDYFTGVKIELLPVKNVLEQPILTTLEKLKDMELFLKC